MHRQHIYQILNHYTSPQDLDPGFAVLDNSGNERPDWFEYWPIRKFLLGETLDENAFYGFLSPKFKKKTNLSAAAAHEFIDASDSSTDVILFSQSIHNAAYFLNAFEYGESEHPGLLLTAQAFFDRIGRPCDLASLVTDSRSEVYSNYFVAKPRFWREWLAINEKLFAIAEAREDPLGIRLATPTNYRAGSQVQMKIFIMERLATWILVNDKSFVARVRDPFVARARTYKLPVAIVCDALKIAYTTQGRRQYKEVFLLVRGLHKYLNRQVKLADVLAIKRVRPYLTTLKSFWAGNHD